MFYAANRDSSHIQKPAGVVALPFHNLHIDEGSTFCCQVTNANVGDMGPLYVTSSASKSKPCISMKPKLKLG